MLVKPLDALAIPGFMSRQELEWLAATAATVESWTEIGGFIGRSMLAVGLALPRAARLQVVDYRLGDYQRAGQTLLTTYEELVEQRPDLRIAMVRAPSREAAKMLRQSDVVFIDGGHSRESVSQDIAAWRDKCRVLCGHDYNREGVRAAVDELLPGAAVVAGSIWMVERKPA